MPWFSRAIPHNSKCRYGERGAADAKPKAQIILDAAKVSAACGGNSEPKQGQRSQSARGFCPRSTMRVPQPDIIDTPVEITDAPDAKPLQVTKGGIEFRDVSFEYPDDHNKVLRHEMCIRDRPCAAALRQHRTIPALRLKHRSGGCGTASALPKCSIRHPVLSALLA